MKIFKADLHIHTCLSPCADVEMSPRNIPAEAKRQMIDILGICDHNSAENTAALKEASARLGLRVLPGLEVTSREEVHILALFDDVESALFLQEMIYASLPGENDEKVFGQQVIADSEDEVLGFSPRLLIGASELDLESIVRAIRSRGGMAIAAHIDRESFSLFGQLGFIPGHLELDALEISPLISLDEARLRFGEPRPLIASSDAHVLSDIGRASTLFRMNEGTVEEIKMALSKIDGRAIVN